MSYTNKDYYDYILKVDGIFNPLHEMYQKILELLLKEGLDKPISDDVMKTFFQTFEIRQYQFNEKELNTLNNLLYYDSAFRRLIENSNGTYSVYPKLKESPTEKDLLQYYSLGLKKNVKEIISALQTSIDKRSSKIKNAKIENYYGTPKYLISRTKAISDAVTLLDSRNDIKDKTLVSKTLSNINFLLNQMLNTLGLQNNEETYLNLINYKYNLKVSKNEYDAIRNLYIEVLKQENLLIDISNEIWHEYSQKNNGVFIHQLTNGAVESDKMKKICVSFYSSNVNIITNYENGNIGYAYPMDISSTFSVCETDAGSWEVTKEEFIERGFPETWQLDETNLWYEYPYHSKLFPPEYIEEKIKAKNNFAEAIIDNRNQKVKPLYCFYTSNATKEQIETITSLAQKQGIEVRHLMTEEEKLVK